MVDGRRGWVYWTILNILDTNGEEVRDEVAIVGAGVIGLSIAFHLAEAGLGKKITIYERSGVGSGASGVQPGGVRQQWTTRVNCLMARESVAFYRELGERLGGPALRLHACGYVFLAHSERRLEELRLAVDIQNELGIDSCILSASEVSDVVPGLKSSEVVGASYLADDAYFDQPQSVVEAFASAATRLGVAVQHSEVTSLAQSGSGWQLTHAKGQVTKASQVVIATGYDTPALIGSLGVTLPIEKQPKYLFLSDPISDRLLEPLVVSSEYRFAAKQLANGRVLASDLGAGNSDSDGPAQWRRHVKNVSFSLLPILQFVTYPVLVEGFYDVTPDHQPILGPVDGLDGLWLAAGFSGHGFMMAPAVGRIVAGAVCNSAQDELLPSFAVDRFEREGLTPELQIV